MQVILSHQHSHRGPRGRGCPLGARGEESGYQSMGASFSPCYCLGMGLVKLSPGPLVLQLQPEHPCAPGTR